MDRTVHQPLMSPCMIEKQWLIKSKIGNVEDDYEFNPKADVRKELQKQFSLD